MSTKTNDASEEAAMRIILRQVAPNISKVFKTYGIEWLEKAENLYLAVRFKENVDITLPENVIVTMNSTFSKKQETLPKGKNEHIDTLYDLFPYMSELFDDSAKEWGLTMYDLFLTARYKGENLADPSQTLGLSLHTKKSVQPKKVKNIV